MQSSPPPGLVKLRQTLDTLETVGVPSQIDAFLLGCAGVIEATLPKVEEQVVKSRVADRVWKEMCQQGITLSELIACIADHPEDALYYDIWPGTPLSEPTVTNLWNYNWKNHIPITKAEILRRLSAWKEIGDNKLHLGFVLPGGVGTHFKAGELIKLTKFDTRHPGFIVYDKQNPHPLFF